MFCKYKPLIHCENESCRRHKKNKPFRNINDTTKKAKCPTCKKLVKKQPHGVVGASLHKDKNNNYVLKFEKFKEEGVFSDWETVLERLEELDWKLEE